MDDRRIRDLIRSGQYEFSEHAEKEREPDEITMAEFEQALAHCETIEDYPNDLRGPSSLVLESRSDQVI